LRQIIQQIPNELDRMCEGYNLVEKGAAFTPPVIELWDEIS
jgi:hypothetical protein